MPDLSASDGNVVGAHHHGSHVLASKKGTSLCGQICLQVKNFEKLDNFEDNFLTLKVRHNWVMSPLGFRRHCLQQAELQVPVGDIQGQEKKK